MRFEAPRLDLHTIVDHNAFTRLDIVVDVVDHLPISKDRVEDSSSATFRQHIRSRSHVRLMTNVHTPFQKSGRRSRSLSELQQHHGIVVVVEKKEARAP